MYSDVLKMFFQILLVGLTFFYRGTKSPPSRRCWWRPWRRSTSPRSWHVGRGSPCPSWPRGRRRRFPGGPVAGGGSGKRWKVAMGYHGLPVWEGHWMEGFCVSKCGIWFDVDVSPENVSGVLQDAPQFFDLGSTLECLWVLEPTFFGPKFSLPNFRFAMVGTFWSGLMVTMSCSARRVCCTWNAS